MDYVEFNDSSNVNLDYFNVQNLSFDHPLSILEIEEFKNLVFSLNNLHQIYFKGNIDVKSIEIVKNLLSISGFIDDGAIEKYIVTKLDKADIRRILSSSYQNPVTWQIAYDFNNKDYILSDIPRCRSFYTYVDNISDSINRQNLSNFEKVMRLYDIVKLYEYKDDNLKGNSNLLTNIISTFSASSYGFNKLFSYLLKEMGFSSFIGEEKTGDGISYVTIVDIKDDKYNIDGIYLFDPSMDSLPKGVYKSNDIRMINYNYFCLPLSKISYSFYHDTLVGALGILAIEDIEISKEKYDTNRDKAIKKDFSNLFSIFNLDFATLHNRVSSSKEIKFDTLFEAIHNIYGNREGIDGYDRLLEENFNTRKNELFIPKTEEVLDKAIKDDTEEDFY